jgi:hypothetical protein
MITNDSGEVHRTTTRLLCRSFPTINWSTKETKVRIANQFIMLQTPGCAGHSVKRVRGNGGIFPPHLKCRVYNGNRRANPFFRECTSSRAAGEF